MLSRSVWYTVVKEKENQIQKKGEIGYVALRNSRCMSYRHPDSDSYSSLIKPNIKQRKEETEMISFAILGIGLVSIAAGTIVYGMVFA